MPSFGTRSKSRLSTCHPLIQLVLNRVIITYDCTILAGWRGKAEQDSLYNSRPQRSQLKWPLSNHNNEFKDEPYSLAVDVGPWPLDWEDINEFHHLGGRVLQAASDLGIQLIWGGNWESFKDYPHYELDPTMLDSL